MATVGSTAGPHLCPTLTIALKVFIERAQRQKEVLAMIFCMLPGVDYGWGHGRSAAIGVEGRTAQVFRCMWKVSFNWTRGGELNAIWRQLFWETCPCIDFLANKFILKRQQSSQTNYLSEQKLVRNDSHVPFIQYKTTAGEDDVTVKALVYWQHTSGA